MAEKEMREEDESILEACKQAFCQLINGMRHFYWESRLLRMVSLAGS